MQVKPQTLMVAIQYVAAQIKTIDRRLQEEEPDDAAELEQLLVSFDLAAEDLKQAYLDALTKFSGLPAYEEIAESWRSPHGSLNRVGLAPTRCRSSNETAERISVTQRGHANFLGSQEMSDKFSMNSYLGMKILSLVREGDYAHAGEEEAIELSMADVEKDSGRLILDAGCGRGGTAEYLHKNGWGRVVGIDVQAESITAAGQNYPDVRFQVSDVCDVDQCLDEHPDIICMFNAYYCFKDQPRALRALHKIAKPDTQIIIFDHVDRGGYQDAPLLDAGEPFLLNPPRLAEMSERLASAGWRTLEIVEIHDAYIGWYTSLVEKIEQSRDIITDTAGQRGYDHVHGLYKGLLNAALTKKLGAAIIKAAPAS